MSIKKNLNASRPSSFGASLHRGKGMSKRLGGIIGCKYKNLFIAFNHQITRCLACQVLLYAQSNVRTIVRCPSCPPGISRLLILRYYSRSARQHVQFPSVGYTTNSVLVFQRKSRLLLLIILVRVKRGGGGGGVGVWRKGRVWGISYFTVIELPKHPK